MTGPDPILQPAIPSDQRAQAAARLPAMRLLDPADWLRVDPAFGAQLAEKARLIAQRRGDVIAALPQSGPALAELLETVRDALDARPDFIVSGADVQRPDGRRVTIDPADPLGSLARLLQEDVCLLERHGDDHVLTAAAVCFPSSWTLAEKIGRPMSAIHAPVAAYDAQVAARVQRMFDHLAAGRILWRANLLAHDDPDLFHARRMGDARPAVPARSRYERSERQTLRRMPKSGALVFTIHTTVARRVSGAG